MLDLFTMHQTLRDTATQLADRHPTIDLVYLFGSRVDGNVGPLSDTDIAVLLEHGTDSFALQMQLMTWGLEL